MKQYFLNFLLIILLISISKEENCGTEEDVEEGTITTDHCNTWQVETGQVCIPNAKKTNCEIQKDCDNGLSNSETVENSVNTNYCKSLTVESGKVCTPNENNKKCVSKNEEPITTTANCGAEEDVEEDTITTDHCNTLQVETGQACIPNAKKTNCEIQKDCDNGLSNSETVENSVNANYCNSLTVASGKVCVPNPQNSKCFIADSCLQVTKFASNEICQNLILDLIDNQVCVKEGERCIIKNLCNGSIPTNEAQCESFATSAPNKKCVKKENAEECEEMNIEKNETPPNLSISNTLKISLLIIIFTLLY